jgi:cation:H+ antiporter
VSVSALLVLLGLVLLVGGGELLVRGSSGLARSLGLSPLVIGLTVVAFATSAPEFAVTLGATLSGEPDLAVGNVVGSNIVNVLLILGVSALVIPLAVASRVVRHDVPVMLGLSVAALVLALDGRVSPLDGVVLLGVLVVYTVTSVVGARRETAARRATERESVAAGTPVWRDVAVALSGVVLLVAGARSLVTGATDIALALQVSTAVIGLTVVAIGTSLPELATSVVAAWRGERDIAIGNIVGSNIFNLGAVLGLSAVLSGGGVPVAASIIAVDLPLMVAAALALLPVAVTGFRMARAEGGLFVLLYAAYTAYLVLDSAGHDALEGFTTVMLWFVLPLVAATLLATLAFEVRQRRRRHLAAPHNEFEPAEPSP